MRKNAFKLLDVKDEVFRRYTAGESTSAIAASYGVAPPSVWRMMKRFGVECRTRSEASTLAATTPEERQRRSAVLKGKPSIAAGKRWTYSRVVKKPALRGANNPRWKGGTTPLQRQIRTSAEYRLWRDAIFQRDGYTCTHCGIHAGTGHRVTLNADHIVALSVLIERHHIVSLAQAVLVAELWDISNGRTLCHECHRFTETYGRNIHRV